MSEETPNTEHEDTTVVEGATDSGDSVEKIKKKMRSPEGRERYLDMVQRERALMMDQGLARSTEQLLDMAGAVSHSELEEEGVKDRASGDQLRAVLPVQSWLPLSIHLIGLSDGVMRIAPSFFCLVPVQSIIIIPTEPPPE